ncbi:MAG: M13 family metallopeptidase, partial [Lachnospiraceae bacterium]|nr:M13 family metallopeptidase [Lachnospiraceae bacterium]
EKKDELKEKAGEKIEEAAEQIEEQKKEKAEEKKAEDKKAEDKKTEDTKAEAAKTEDTKTEDIKTEDKKTEDKNSDEALKTEESVSGDKASTDAEVSETGNLKDGIPWVDYDLVDNRDKSVKTDPADDFYLYVNKYWLNNTSIKEGKSSASTFIDIADETRKKAEKLFEDDSLKSSDAKLIKSYHTAILDWDERNAAGTGPLEALVANIQKAETIDEINKLYLEDENRVFLEKFVNINNTASFNDSSKYIIAFDSCNLMLSDAAEYSKRTELGDRYYEGRKDEVVRMLVKFGYKKDKAEEIFENALAFEGELAKDMLTAEDNMQTDIIARINNEMKKNEIKEFVANYPLFEILSSYGYPASKNYLVYEPRYMKALDNLYTDDNVEDIKAYLLSHLMIKAAGLLDEEAYNIVNDAGNTIRGSKGKVDDKEYAFELVSDDLTTPMDKTFIEKYDSSKMKKDITDLCKREIAYYRGMLEEEDWLSDEVKKKAIKKLDNITINAVYPDKWKNYSALKLDGLSFFECKKAIADFDIALDASRTNKKVDPAIWEVNILDANAYYNPANNSINIIRGLLDGAFYREDMSEEELFAGIGSAIGHEISHAFDTKGAQYDENGNLINWWTDEDLKTFHERADKLAKYYSGITAFNGEKVRGDNIKTEAIADMAGMKCVLGLASENKDFDYKAFFEANAAVWRGLYTKELEYMLLTQDVHPLRYLRVNATVQQFDEFYETYGIKEGDNMYLAPENRVLVW